jgi:WXG100 family type VII secretion target
MRDAATAIGDGAAHIEQAMESVTNEVNNLGPDRFSSAAADEFRAAYGRKTAQLREAHDMLLEYRTNLNEAADDIEQAARPV